MPCHGRSQLYLADLSCIRLISNEALMHFDTTVGCYVEAPLKGGGIQQFDSVQRHSDSVTHCQLGLNLKVESGQKETPSGHCRPHLGKMFKNWVKRF